MRISKFWKLIHHFCGGFSDHYEAHDYCTLGAFIFMKFSLIESLYKTARI